MTAASNSEARKRQQARETPQPPATATNEGAVGAEVVGRLTEAERDSLLDIVDEAEWHAVRDLGFDGDELLSVVESIVRDHAERAWDEGVRRCDEAWHDRSAISVFDLNPY